MASSRGKKAGPTLVERRDFLAHLTWVKHRAGELGLFETMQALDAGVKVSGYELAHQMQREAKAKIAAREARFMRKGGK